ncbi:MAG: acyl-CoA-binding protein [Myxococcota bacterium]
MATVEEFEAAKQQVEGLTRRPSNEDLLNLYGLYKQATAGDVSGKKPGRLDIKGRAKFEAWERRRGLSAEAARAEYVALVGRLAG